MPAPLRPQEPAETRLQPGRSLGIRERLARALVVLSLASASGLNDARAAEADSPLEMQGNAAVVSNYVSRGLTQSWGRPAAQAELEIEHEIGLYAGTFVSTVAPQQFPGGHVEVDVWAGYEREFGDGFAAYVEGYGYLYPGANYSQGSCAAGPCASQTFNTLEARVGASWRWLSTRFSYALSNYFGDSPETGFQSGTKGTWYLQADANYPIPGHESWHAVGHLGYTRYSAQFAAPNPAGVQDPNYWDWRFGATKSFRNEIGTLRVGAFYSEASNGGFYSDVPSLTGSGTRDLGRAAFVLEIRQTF